MMSGLFYNGFSILSVATDVIIFLTAVLGLILLLFALIVPILTYLNVLGLRDRLFNVIGFLPGFRSRTTWKAAFGIFGYTLLVSIVLLSIAGMLLPPDNIEVSDTALSSQEVTAGDSIEVSGVVENVGNETLSETIELTANGEVIETKEVTLKPGERRELTFNTQLSEPGEYEVELHDSTIATVVVRDNIVFDETTFSEEEIGEGQSVEITGVVANVGNTSDTISIDLLVDGDVEDTKEIALESGEERKFRFTRRFDEEGEYSVEVNNIPVGSLSVVQLRPAEFEIDDSSLSEKEIERGETVEITVVVRNIGDKFGESTLEITSDGAMLDKREISLSAGEEQRFTFTHRFMNPGDFNIAVNEEGINVLSVTGLTDEQIFSTMEQLLLSYGVNVKDSERIGNEAYLTHIVDEPQPVEEYLNIGLVSGAYAGALDNGLPTDRLIVTMDASEIDEGVWEYRIETEWIEMLDRGEIDENELHSRVIGTIEEVD